MGVAKECVKILGEKWVPGRPRVSLIKWAGWENYRKIGGMYDGFYRTSHFLFPPPIIPPPRPPRAESRIFMSGSYKGYYEKM